MGKGKGRDQGKERRWFAKERIDYAVPGNPYGLGRDFVDAAKAFRDRCAARPCSNRRSCSVSCRSNALSRSDSSLAIALSRGLGASSTISATNRRPNTNAMRPRERSKSRNRDMILFLKKQSKSPGAVQGLTVNFRKASRVVRAASCCASRQSRTGSS